MKKLLSMFLSLVMLLSVIPMIAMDKSPVTVYAYSNGDTITYGSWPQTEVTDTTTKNAIRALIPDSKMWRYTDWTYNTDQTSSTAEAWTANNAWYVDVIYNSNKYRVLIFGSGTHHGYVNNYSSPSSGYNYYYFKWEPIKWKVVNNADGTLLAQNVLLSDVWDRPIYKVNNKFVHTSGQSSSTYYNNNYSTSYIRNYLNYTFYDQAFTATQKSNIKNETNGNTCGGNSSDKVWLPASWEVKKTSWGFLASDSADANRKCAPTAYAKATGAYVYEGYSPWWIRDASSSDGSTKNSKYVRTTGEISNTNCDTSYYGIRPCIHLSTLKNDSSINQDCLGALKTGETIYFGNYPKTKITDATLIYNLGNATKTWESYRFFAGSGSADDGKMQGTDDMEYADFMYNGVKYRAVRINNYRPSRAYYPGSASNSQQDENGYSKGNIYYYRYDPIAWYVINASTRTLMAENILDSQEYQNMTFKTSDGKYVNCKGSSTYASYYGSSSINYWLSREFYNTAFSTVQQGKLKTFTVTHDASDSKYKTTNHSTRISLPSKSQAGSYSGSITDYAKCMGYSSSNKTYWTDYAAGDSKITLARLGSSTTDNNYVEYNYLGGVRPVIQLADASSQDYTTDSSYLWSVKRPRYSVTLNKEGKGTVVGGGYKYVNGEFVNISCTPATGYTFSCWKNSSGTELSTSSYPQNWFTVRTTVDQTYTAVFTPMNYTVTIKADTGGQISRNNSTWQTTYTSSYKYDSAYNMYAKADSGYRFDHWEKSDGSTFSTNASTTFTCVGAQTYTAKFVKTYKITLTSSNTNYGTVSGGGTYDTGKSVTITATPKSGYKFEGWYENGARINTNNNPYTFTASKDRTIQALFVAIPSYTITLTNTTGGTVSGAGSYQEGKTCTAVATPSSGYNFEGWYEGSTKVSANASYSFTVTKARTLQAKFTKQTTYNISASADPAAGGTITGTGSYVANASCTLKATAKTGYTFLGWYEGSSQVSTSASYTFTVTKARTLVAKFKINSYTITVSADPTAGGTVSGGGTYDYNSSRTVTASAKTGYTFLGWYEGTTQLTTSTSYTFTVTKARTLVAKFKINTYTITATSEDTNKGTVTGGGTYDYNKSITLKATPKAGYSFDGWYEGSSKVSSSASYTFTVTKARTLVAKFKINSYTITVNSENTAYGSVMGGGTFSYGATVSLNALPASGYKFAGWYEGSTQVSGVANYSFTATKNLTLTAKFIKEAAVTYEIIVTHEGEGVVAGGGIYEKGQTANLIAAPSGDYKFEGWYEGETKVSSDAAYSFTVTKNRNLVAKFLIPINDLTPGEATPEQVEEFITNLPDDGDPAGTKFEFLLARMKKSAKTAITLTWKKPTGAAYYIVFGNRCGKGNKYKKLVQTDANVITVKGLKKGTYHKFLVAAFSADDKLLGTSVTMHITTTGGKNTNAKEVTTAAKKNKVSVAKGKTFALKAKQTKVDASKALPVHRKLRYKTTNKKVATVSAKGVIKGVKKGTCYVYVYAQNGRYKKIKVTVK